VNASTNTVRVCYAHATGQDPLGNDRAYLDWCEGMANRWISLLEEFGYKSWSNEIRTLTGSITYHEWLKKEVGL